MALPQQIDEELSDGLGLKCGSDPDFRDRTWTSLHLHCTLSTALSFSSHRSVFLDLPIPSCLGMGGPPLWVGLWVAFDPSQTVVVVNHVASVIGLGNPGDVILFLSDSNLACELLLDDP